MTQRKFLNAVVGAHKNELDINDDFVFIHIPKTGGMSIRRSLSNADMPVSGAHKSVSAYQEMYGHGVFEEKRGYALIRNPLDRLVSSYFFGRGRLDGEAYQESRAKKLFILEYAEFIKKLYDNREEYFDKLLVVIPQSRMVSGLDGSIPIKLYSFENIAGLLRDLSDLSGKKIETVHINKSEHGFYMDYYTPETIEMVMEMYADDVFLYESLLSEQLDRNVTIM